MMGRTLVLAAAMALASTALADAGPPDWVVEARQKSIQLASSLQEALREALGSRGPAGGVETCKTQAPEIAAQLSDERFEVGRTALRIRNPDNAPDAWEASVLQRFEKSMARGADPAGLENWRVEQTEDGLTGRYMKAIPTGPQCVLCHGAQVSAPLQETIRRLYPDDQATGFAPGELRGAFTVTVALPPSDSRDSR